MSKVSDTRKGDINMSDAIVGAYDKDSQVIGVSEGPYTPLLTTADTLVKTGAGILHTITFSPNDAAPTAGSIIIYDNTAESGTQLFNMTFTTSWFAPFSVTLDARFSTGLYVGFTTTNDVNCTVTYL